MTRQSSGIPIKNIYYLLCYAWDRLAEGGVADVSPLDSTELADLFATVMVSGVRHLHRRGLSRDYETFDGELRSLRGRVAIAESARRLLLAHGRAHCEFDDLTHNTPANQIIKATLKHLATANDLDPSLRDSLRALHRDLHGINEIRLSRLSFRRVQLHGNTRFYRFLINVCELVWASLLVDEKSGEHQFQDFSREPKQMARLYESFILNFLRRERSDLNVKKEKILWAAAEESEGSLEYLPSMETDISVRDGGATLVIEAKYYEKTLSSYHEATKLRAAHLYQLFSYLKNLEPRGGADAISSGLILYPTVQENLELDYLIHGHRLHVRTLDLGQDWKQIEESLLAIVDHALHHAHG